MPQPVSACSVQTACERGAVYVYIWGERGLVSAPDRQSQRSAFAWPETAVFADAISFAILRKALWCRRPFRS